MYDSRNWNGNGHHQLLKVIKTAKSTHWQYYLGIISRQSMWNKWLCLLFYRFFLLFFSFSTHDWLETPYCDVTETWKGKILKFMAHPSDVSDNSLNPTKDFINNAFNARIQLIFFLLRLLGVCYDSVSNASHSFHVILFCLFGVSLFCSMLSLLLFRTNCSYSFLQ